MENIENCKNDANDMESLKKHIFIIMYWLCNKFGILQTYCNRDQKSKINIVLIFLLMLPLIGSFLYHFVIGFNYSWFTLRSQENTLINCYYLIPILTIINYINFKKTNFFGIFLKYLKEYKDIQLTSTPPLRRNFKKIKIIFSLIWFLFFTEFLFETIFNFINYDKNEKNGKNYKLSMFYGKSTYICDALIMLYARTIIIFFNIIYCCIYGVLYYESEVFKNECQELLKESPLNIQSKFCLLSRKHSKFYEMLEFSHKKLGNNIDVIIFNFTIMIIFEISLLWHYFLNISNIIEIIQHFLSAFSMIYFEIIILMPINYMDKNLQIIKNIILNKSLIWNEQNLQLKGKALSIVTRSNHCEYYWLFFGLIPVKDKIIPILVLLTIILSAIIGPAVF